MPNWSEGVLKIRGRNTDIISFLKYGIYAVNYLGEKREIETYLSTAGTIDLLTDDNNWFYVRGTTRGFIDTSEINLWYNNLYDENILCLAFKQAWAIKTNELASISKLYNLDIKVYSYEFGMEFNQDIEIARGGNIIQDKTITFNNYQWECTNPTLGG